MFKSLSHDELHQLMFTLFSGYRHSFDVAGRHTDLTEELLDNVLDATYTAAFRHH